MHIAATLVMSLAALACAAASDNGSDPFADNACVQCHRDLPGRSSEIVDLEWHKSVHYAAKVGCEGCHGGSASVRREQFSSDEEFKRAAHLERSPEFLLIHRDGPIVSAASGRSVSYLCGKCHMKIKEYHLGSPHGEFGQPTCIYCHGGGSHRIEKASAAIIDMRPRREGGRCSTCHRAATMEAVARVKKTVTEVAARIETSGEQYRYLEAAGYRNLELEQLHHHANEALSQVRQTFHSFNMRDISKLTTSIDATADRTTAAFDLVQRLKVRQRQQTAVGAAAVLFLLMFAGLLVYYKNTFLLHAGLSAAPALNTSKGPAPAASMAGKVVIMSPSHIETPVNSDGLPFPTMGIYVMIAHFIVTMACLLIGVVEAYRSNSGTESLPQHLGQLLCWPLLAMGTTVGDEHPSLFWPLMLANSALWGFAAAAIIYLARRSWMHWNR